jgi:hypothetical protein
MHVALSFGLQGKEVAILKLNAEVIILKSSAIQRKCLLDLVRCNLVLLSGF